MVNGRRVVDEPEIHSGGDRPVPELVVFVAAKRRVESAQPLECAPFDRAMTGQQVTIHISVSGPARLLEHRFPPSTQDHAEEATRSDRWLQVADANPVGHGRVKVGVCA